jgi:lysophospholipase L1-like esterase
MSPPSPSVDRLIRRLRWTLSAFSILVGVWAFDRESPTWAILTVVLFCAPAALQAVGRRPFPSLGGWLAVFLIGQTALTILVNPRHYLTLPPHLRTQVDVRGGLPGIEGVQTITTDGQGFRVVPPIDYAAKRGFRIVAVGGSTTEQIYLDDRRTWPYLMQQQLTADWSAPVEVINTGVSGLRAEHHLATLKRVMRFAPDLAVILVGVNDWNRHIVKEMARRGHPERVLDPMAEHRWRFFRNSLLGRLIWRRPAEPGLAAFRIDHGEYYTPQRNSLSRPVQLSFRPATVDEHYAATIRAIARLCRRHATRCMFVTQPTAYRDEAPEEVRRGFWMTPPNQDYTLDLASLVTIAALYNDTLRAIAAEENALACNPAPSLPPTFAAFYDEVHLNAGGSRMLADLLARCISQAVPRP